MLIVLALVGSDGQVALHTQTIPFRTLEACQAAAPNIERRLAAVNAVAMCVER